MKRITTHLPGFLLLSLAISAHAVLPASLELHIGEQKVIQVFDAEMISVGNPDLIELTAVDDVQLIIRGRKTGETDLIAWNGTGKRQIMRIQVFQPVSGKAAGIRDLLRNVENIRVSTVGERIIIEGRLLLKSDYDLVQTVAMAFGEGMVLNLTTLDRGRENEMLARMIADDIGLSSVNARVIGDTVFLSGHVYNQLQKDRLMSLAETQFGQAVDLLEVRDIMIGIDIIFMQMNKSRGHDLGGNLLDGSGINLTGSIEGSRTRAGRGEYSPMVVQIGYNVSLQHALKLIMSSGDGSILSRPHLSTKSGESGRFHSGGEFFFKVEGGQSVDLKSVEYGLILEVQPELRSADEILCQVSIDVTVPVSKAGSEDLNLERFSTRNTVVCRLGESIIISGFVENLRNHFQERAPLLGRIPLLNMFFAQSVRSNSDKELVAILTPRLLTPETGGTDPNLSELETTIRQHIRESDDAVLNP